MLMKNVKENAKGFFFTFFVSLLTSHYFRFLCHFKQTQFALVKFPPGIL
jgi:hypothetical protein